MTPKFIRCALSLIVLVVCASAPAQLSVTQFAGFGSGGDAVVSKWAARVRAASGTFASDSVSIASSLHGRMKSRSYYSKIIYLLPLLGSNLAAARVPLIDRLNVGIASNSNFVDADFTQATGLKGNGSSKRLDLLIKPTQLGTGSNGGMGYWENNIDFGGSSTESMGCYDDSGVSNRFDIDLRNTISIFNWGNPSNNANQSVSAGNFHYYGQRSGATSRQIFKTGSSIGTNTTSDAASQTNERNIFLMGLNYSTVTFWKGRCAVCYLTDGTLTTGEVSDLHSDLSTYLITPTGR